MKQNLTLIFLISLCIMMAEIMADVINIPNDYETIQAGIEEWP